jgi:hypothetical protein
MSSNEYSNHHYVPEWYQERFMLSGEHQLYYLDLKPDTFFDPRGIAHQTKAIKHQGKRMNFAEKHLYTAYINGVQRKEIEKFFFGEIDRKGVDALSYFNDFDYPPKDWKDYFTDFMLYVSTQKLRTPKGLLEIERSMGTTSKFKVLNTLLRLRGLYCAHWTECVWMIADASKSDTKFIVSDHPVTVYNREYGPRSFECRNGNDPDTWQEGTHTIFPLSLDKILILTNLSWVRNPYQSAKNPLPNPNPLRDAIFKITDIQVRRSLSEEEVRQINFIIKSRALRYVAAAKEEWLYPERHVSRSDWSKYGHGYLLMPDPRPIHGGGTIMWGGGAQGGGSMDEYGRRPWEVDFEEKERNKTERKTLSWFKGEFARLFGPYRRGRSMGSIVEIDNEYDDAEYHKYHLELERKSYKERNKPPTERPR